jgi:hypothetical protein
MLGSALALYLLAPENVTGPVWHTGTYPRFAVVFLLTWIVIPKPDLGQWRGLALVPIVGACLYFDARLFAQFRAFHRETRGLEQIIAALPEHPRLLPLKFETRTPSARLPALEFAPAWIAAVRGGYDPSLFAYTTNPVGFRERVRPPVPDPRRPASFDVRRHGAGFDYVLVQARTASPVQPGPQLELVVQEGLWTLFRVKH